MYLMTHSESQHANTINNGNSTTGDINGMTTSPTLDETDGNTSVSNSPQLGSISGVSGINNDMSQLDVGSADGSGNDGKSTRFKPNVDNNSVINTSKNVSKIIGKTNLKKTKIVVCLFACLLNVKYV